jgi:DNA-binding transcriptional MerR regulator
MIEPFAIFSGCTCKTFGRKVRAAIVRRLETRFVVTGRVTERNQRIAKLREDGLPLAEIGALEGISRERVRQILLERQVLAQRAAVRRELGSLSLDEALSRRVDELGLSSRPANALKNDDAITNVRDLIQMSEAEVLRMWRCARASLNEIKEVLALMGLHLAARRPWREAREYKPWWDHPTAE